MAVDDWPTMVLAAVAEVKARAAAEGRDIPGLDRLISETEREREEVRITRSW